MRLYVENYDAVENIALIDFVSKEDFCYFRNKCDWNEDMRNEVSSEEPTMLLIAGIKVTNLKKGCILEIDKTNLLELYEYKQYEDTSDIISRYQSTSTIFMKFNISEEFSNFFKYKSITYKDYHLLKPKNSCKCIACNLKHICTNTCVYNVGEGNCNRIYGNNTQIFFDYGASVLYSDEQIRKLMDSIPKFNDRTSLIISHWDADHCNMLKFTEIEDLKNLCCVFVPNKCISLTSQIIAKKLLDNCSFVVAINEANGRRIKRKISMYKVFENNNASLYVGEKSSSINNSGLMLFVKGKRETVIFTGDHNNWQVFNNVYSALDPSTKEMPTNIIVPHHGGKTGSFKNLMKIKKPNIAAVSVGGNYYGHPTTECRNYYCKNGFKWLSTMTLNKNIDFEI